MTIDEQKEFQEKIFKDRFEIINRSNDLLLTLLKNIAPTKDNLDSISKVATVRYHFYAELMDSFDRQLIAASAAQEQNAYILQTKGGNA